MHKAEQVDMYDSLLEDPALLWRAAQKLKNMDIAGPWHEHPTMGGWCRLKPNGDFVVRVFQGGKPADPEDDRVILPRGALVITPAKERKMIKGNTVGALMRRFDEELEERNWTLVGGRDEP